MMLKDQVAAILADPLLVGQLKEIFAAPSKGFDLSALTALGSAIFAGAAALFIWRQTLADHERSRRAFAVEVIFKWIESIQRESAGINQFVERLSGDQCTALVARDSLSVTEKEKTRIISLLRHQFPDIEKGLDPKDGQINLTESHSNYIRYLAVKYLNNLETVMTAWAYAVADEEIIVRQFQYLVDEKEGLNAMYTFRQKLGAEHFPSINKFAKHMARLREYQQAQIGRSKIV